MKRLADAARAAKLAEKEGEDGSDGDEKVASGDDAEKAAEEVASEGAEDAEAKSDAEPKEGEEGEGGALTDKEEVKARYERQMKQLAIDEADDEDEFSPLELKIRINKYFEENPTEKKIPSDTMSEAVRWRLSQNDCQNRGYILDGYPTCYKTALEVFFITPEQPKPKEKKTNEDGEEVEEPEEVEEEEEAEEKAKKYAPKFQKHIYPDSFILLRGSDEILKKRAAALKAEDNTKWDPENLERRLQVFKENNDVSLFAKANNDPMLGHPKAQKFMLPLSRFF